MGKRWAQKQRTYTARRRAKTKGPAKKQAAKPLGGPADLGRKRCPAKGGAKSALRYYATDFYAKPEQALADHRGGVFALAGGRGGHGKWEAGSTHLHATGDPAWGQKKGNREMADQIVGLRAAWEPPPPCPTCALTHRGVRHRCSRGHHGYPRGVCVLCTPRHTPLRARLASQPPAPGVCQHANTQATHGTGPPGGLHARHGLTHPPAPDGGERGMKRQREAPPGTTRQAPALDAPSGTTRPRGH